MGCLDMSLERQRELVRGLERYIDMWQIGESVCITLSQSFCG